MWFTMSFQRMSKHYRVWITGTAAAAAAASLAAVAPTALADKKDDSLFDPEALERGAKALREINKSPFAKQVSVRADGSDLCWMSCWLLVCRGTMLHMASCCSAALLSASVAVFAGDRVAKTAGSHQAG